MLIKKEEYLKFMILIKIRYNIEECENSLKFKKKLMKENTNPYDNYYYERQYNDMLDFYNENIKILNELFNIRVKDNFNDIDNEIFKKWSIILEYLKNNKCDYEWTKKDFVDTKYYEMYNNITSYDLRWEKKDSNMDTNPIYFDFFYLKYLDDKFSIIFKEIVDNGLFNPNKRTLICSREPFWALAFPDNYEPTDLSNKIIFDKRCNYRMLDNGTDNVLLLLRRFTGYFGKDDLTSSQKEFALNFLFKIIKENNCSILQEYVECLPGFILNDPLIFVLFANEEYIAKYDEFNNLYKYCISEEGVKNQCNALEHKTEGCGRAIDFYIELIEKDNPENKEGIKLLKGIM